MTSGCCHFSSLHSRFADCLVPGLPLPINLHHSPSLYTSASWHLSRPLDAPLSLFVPLFRRLLSPSPSTFPVPFAPILSSSLIPSPGK